MEILRIIGPLFLIVALVSCNPKSDIKVETNKISDQQVVTEEKDNSLSNPYFSTLIDQVKIMRNSTSGRWRYDAHTVRCDSAEIYKCYQSRYDAFIPDCFDIIDKPCLEKLLVITSKRTIKNNPSLDKMVDTSEVILSFTLFNKNASLKNSSIIGTPISELEKTLGLDFSKNEHTILINEGRIELEIESDILRAISYTPL